jgi:hypothetical protein
MLVQDMQLGGIETNGAQFFPTNIVTYMELEGCATYYHHIGRQNKEMVEISWKHHS